MAGMFVRNASFSYMVPPDRDRFTKIKIVKVKDSFNEHSALLPLSTTRSTSRSPRPTIPHLFVLTRTVQLERSVCFLYLIDLTVVILLVIDHGQGSFSNRTMQVAVTISAT
jgi:hypothetical protein